MPRSSELYRPAEPLREPIFVVGAARSGTTWVEEILGAHPLVAAVHESFLFEERGAVGGLVGSRGHSPRSDHPPADSDLLESARSVAIRELAAALEPGHRFLVEKSPSHLYAIPLISTIFPGARFVHVVRDGRDVTVSVLAAAQSWAPAWGRSFGRSVLSSAAAWKDAIRVTRRHGARLGDRYLEIRYESVRSDTAASARRLFDFCRIPWDETIVRDVCSATDFATRHVADERGFRRGGRVGDWRAAFGLGDAVAFSLVAGRTLIDLGYERSRLWPVLARGRRTTDPA